MVPLARERNHAERFLVENMCRTREETAMKKIVLAMTTAAALCAGVPLSTTMVAAQDVDVRIGPRGPGVVIDTDARRYRDRGYRDRDCRSVTVSEWRDGVRVTRTERRCD
jgi:hypothetical protein